VTGEGVTAPGWLCTTRARECVSSVWLALGGVCEGVWALHNSERSARIAGVHLVELDAEGGAEDEKGYVRGRVHLFISTFACKCLPRDSVVTGVSKLIDKPRNTSYFVSVTSKLEDDCWPGLSPSDVVTPDMLIVSKPRGSERRGVTGSEATLNLTGGPPRICRQSLAVGDVDSALEVFRQSDVGAPVCVDLAISCLNVRFHQPSFGPRTAVFLHLLTIPTVAHAYVWQLCDYQLLVPLTGRQGTGCLHCSAADGRGRGEYASHFPHLRVYQNVSALRAVRGALPSRSHFPTQPCSCLRCSNLKPSACWIAELKLTVNLVPWPTVDNALCGDGSSSREVGRPT
jgi:hypothetical protein